MTRQALLWGGLTLSACTASLELDAPTDAEAEAVDAVVKPRFDAEVDAAEPDAVVDAAPPECVDDDGDGYGAHCAAGPDCDDARADVSPGAVERCNGVDDDCDGTPDEAFEGLGTLCSVGVGACVRPGMRVCDAAGEGVTCQGEPGGAVVELCNGIDDDCDTQVDEGVPSCCDLGATRACGRAVGRCSVGEQVCTPTLEWGPCSGTGERDEACNGADDDCDGLTDEGVTNACGACGAVPDERCNARDDDCDGIIDEGVANACGGCGAVPDEVCNGRDDDCDNRTDEGVTNACGACGPVPPERCNTRDDDCDNRVDEGVLNACGACGRPPVELCNGVDEDCDAVADEGTCAPEIDACEGLSPIALDELRTGPIGGALAVHRGACGGRGPEVAFTFTPAVAQVVCVSTAGSDFDTTLHVRQGACADGMEVGCNDDAPLLRSLQSQVAFSAVAATPYVVFVDAFRAGQQAGIYHLRITPGACTAP